MSKDSPRESCHDPLEAYLRNLTRRRFFGSMAGGMLGARAAGMSTPERMGRAVGVLMLAAAAGLMVS